MSDNWQQIKRDKFQEMCLSYLYDQYHKTHKIKGITRVIDSGVNKDKRFKAVLINKNKKELVFHFLIDNNSFNQLSENEFIFSDLFDKKTKYDKEWEYLFSYKTLGEVLLNKC